MRRDDKFLAGSSLGSQPLDGEGCVAEDFTVELVWGFAFGERFD